MIPIQLDMEEWQRVLAVLAQAPWATVNPIIMAIGNQLREAQERRDSPIQQGARRGDGATAPQ